MLNRYEVNLDNPASEPSGPSYVQNDIEAAEEAFPNYYGTDTCPKTKYQSGPDWAYCFQVAGDGGENGDVVERYVQTAAPKFKTPAGYTVTVYPVVLVAGTVVTASGEGQKALGFVKGILDAIDTFEDPSETLIEDAICAGSI